MYENTQCSTSESLHSVHPCVSAVRDSLVKEVKYTVALKSTCMCKNRAVDTGPRKRVREPESGALPVQK